MRYYLTKSATFEAAHWLPNVPTGHKCGRIHGHSYTVAVEVSGDLDGERMWVRDFSTIATPLQNFVRLLDHRTLNDIDGLDNPTSEALCAWFWKHLEPVFRQDLATITVAETATSSCTLRRA